MDLIDLVGFELDFFYESVRALNQDAPIFELSCRTGQGVGQWIDWLVGMKTAVNGSSL
jgi:hydrogenase nickel incorporation protein HypB